MDSVSFTNPLETLVKEFLTKIKDINGKKIEIEYKKLIKKISTLKDGKTYKFKTKQYLPSLLNGIMKINKKKRVIYRNLINELIAKSPNIKNEISEHDTLCEFLFVNLNPQKPIPEKYEYIKKNSNTFHFIENASLNTFLQITPIIFDYFFMMYEARRYENIDHYYGCLEIMLKYIINKIEKKQNNTNKQKYYDLLYIAYIIIDFLIVLVINLIGKPKIKPILLINKIMSLINLIVTVEDNQKITLLSINCIEKLISFYFWLFSQQKSLEEEKNDINDFFHTICKLYDQNIVINNILNILYMYSSSFDNKNSNLLFFQSLYYQQYKLLFEDNNYEQNKIDNILNDLNSIFDFNNKYSVLKGILHYFKFSIEKQEFKSQIILIPSINLLTLLKSLATNHYFISVLQDSNLYFVLLNVINLIKNDSEISLSDGLNEVYEIINQGIFQNEKVTDNESIEPIIQNLENYLKKSQNDPRKDNTLYQLRLVGLKFSDTQLNYNDYAEKILKRPEEIENNLSELLSAIYNCEKDCKDLINNVKNIIETANKLEDGVKDQYNNIVSHNIESTIDKERRTIQLLILQWVMENKSELQKSKTENDRREAIIKQYFEFQLILRKREAIHKMLMNPKMIIIIEKILKSNFHQTICDLFSLILTRSSNQLLCKSVYKLLFIAFQNDQCKESQIIDIIQNFIEQNDFMKTNWLIESLFSQIYKNNIKFLLERIEIGSDQRIYLRIDDKKNIIPTHIYGIKKDGFAYLNYNIIIQKLVEYLKTIHFKKKKIIASLSQENEQTDKKKENKNNEICTENFEKEQKEKSIYGRCLNKLLQHCYSINDETLKSCVDYIVQFIKNSTKLEIDSYIYTIIGTINYQFTFPQDLFLHDIFIENKVNKEMIFSIICPNFNVKNITKFNSFFIYYFHSLTDDISINNLRKIDKGSILYQLMNSIVEQCKDTLIKDPNDNNGIKILSILFQLKDLLSLCDDTIINNIIFILLLIGWRNYPLYLNILSSFGVSEYIENESTKQRQMLIGGFQSNFYLMFSDILLFFYISFLSHSQKIDLYSLITKNINSTSQTKVNKTKDSQNEKLVEQKVNKSIRTIIFKEMLYMLCIINNSKRKNKSEQITDIPLIKIYSRKNEIIIINPPHANTVNIRYITTVSDLSYIFNFQNKETNNNDNKNKMRKLVFKNKKEIGINEGSFKSKTIKKQEITPSIEYSLQDVVEIKIQANHKNAQTNLIENLLSSPPTIVYDFNVIYYNIDQKSSKNDYSTKCRSQIKKGNPIPSEFNTLLGSISKETDDLLVYHDNLFTLNFHLLNISKKKSDVQLPRVNIFLLDHQILDKDIFVNQMNIIVAFFITKSNDSNYLITTTLHQINATPIISSINNSFLSQYRIDVRKPSGLQYFFKHLAINGEYIKDISGINNFYERYQLITQLCGKQNN